MGRVWPLPPVSWNAGTSPRVLSFRTSVIAEVVTDTAPADTFTVESYRVIVDRREDGAMVSEATVKVYASGERLISTEEGNGPVNALDRALRKALGLAYPQLAKMELALANILKKTSDTQSTVVGNMK